MTQGLQVGSLSSAEAIHQKGTGNTNKGYHEGQLVERKRSVTLGFDNVSVQLFFDDLLYYDNQSNQKTKTKLETMADLMQSAKEFLQEVRVKGRLLNLAVVGETVNITLDESTLIDRNIQVILEFTVIYTSSVACLNLDFEQEKADYPYPFESWDYEDGTRRTDATYMNEPIPTP